MILQDNTQKTVNALAEILKPNADGAVVFGAKNEPFRPSQVEGLSSIKAHLENGETKGYIVMPGGSGKTRLGMALAYAMYKHDRNSLFVVPNQQALRDFVNKANELKIFGNDVGAVYEGEKRIGKLTFITYASLLQRVLGDEASAEVQELAKADHRDAEEHHEAVPAQSLRIDPSTFDLAVWDEAHMYLTHNAQNLLKKFDHAVNIGLTATPRYYTGKEVSHVFGKKILEIDLGSAKRRKEVCDFENILIDTGIQTGIQLASPEQEESAQVSSAINRRERNLIFADLYKNGEMTVSRNGDPKKHTLAGEPTIVFGASIDHVHDLATAINDALTPALKHDPLFRERLHAKGINPDDPQLVIAAPIHTGASAAHTGMSLDQRNALVDRYHNRKVLMLCATSVLQQSFDSPMTSVVMDAVPRQTFVGVGQAGMRATRPGKEMAFIINTEDADHPSLTFADFYNHRGHEEGVQVEIADNQNGKGQRAQRVVPTTGDKDAPVAHYKLTYGAALHQLAAQRKKQFDALSLYASEALNGRHGGEKYAQVNRLIADIATGNREAESKLIEEISPWMERTARRIAYQEKVDTDGYKEPIQDAVSDILLSGIHLIRNKNIANWSQFGTRFQKDLRRRLFKILHTPNDPPFSQLSTPIKPGDVAGREIDPLHSAQQSELIDAVTGAIDDLPYRESQIIKLRHGLGDGHSYTLAEAGRIFGATPERVRQIEKIAKRKLRKRIEPMSAVLEWLQERHNPIDDKIMVHKEVIRLCLFGELTDIDDVKVGALAYEFQVPKAHIYALTNLSHPSALVHALNKTTTDKIIDKLPEQDKYVFAHAVDKLRGLCGIKIRSINHTSTGDIGLA